MLAIWCLLPLPFLKPTWTLGSSRFHVVLKPGLENFEHYFTSLWDECSCAVAWAFFGIAFLWDCNENWPFPVVATAEFSKFAGILRAELSQHHLSRFEIAQLEFHHRIWNSSTGIPSPLLALLVVMLSKAHLTLHSRMSGSRWVITPSWLSWSWRSFLVS